MFKSTNQEKANTIKKLVEYLDTQPDGEELSWERVEADTSIKMSNTGRAMVRQALRQRRRPYEAVRGMGIRLSHADTALTIARSKLVAIDHSVRRADKTQTELQDRHFEQMRTADQQKFLMLTSFFGAIRSVAKSVTAKAFKAQPVAAIGVNDNEAA